MLNRIHHYYFSVEKRLFDISLSLILIILSFPLLATISLLIFLTIGEPIIFKQKRVGKNKKVFTIYKFRTMVRNAQQLKSKYKKQNQAPEPMFKIYNDPRFIGIGQFLSKSGLDELPQLFNILKAEMSFVGPRPLPITESKNLNKNWNFRYQVKPGIFSKWALSNDKHQSLTKWRDLEVTTLKKGSLKTDIQMISRIIFKQIKTFFN
jgi:lipopolysaccharide/colanic/teichoic acid biosynthesis glycosyltransferase